MNKSDKIIYWTVIMVLFVFSLWATSSRNMWMKTTFEVSDRMQKLQSDFEKVFSSFSCYLRPEAKSVRISMGMYEKENYSGGAFVYNTHNNCAKDVYKDIKITTY